MRRIILALTASVLSITVLMAQPITQQEAMERAIRHITANDTQMRAPMRESQNKYILTTKKNDTIHVDMPTGISPVETVTQPDRYYDLQGRALLSIPTEPGIYLRRGRKEKKQ